MLETQGLLLQEWSAEPSPGGTPARAILNAATGAPLGYAYRQPVPRSWWRWLLPSVLAVHESEDQPLLFTVRRSWGLGGRWEVRDADEHPVGVVRRDCVLDRFGLYLARIEELPGQGTVVFRDAGGRVLAQAASTGSETRLSFGLPLEGEPFAKMVVLAAALVRAPRP